MRALLAQLPRLPEATPPRLVASLTGTAVVLTLVGSTLARAGRQTGVVSLIAYALIAALGLILALSRSVPGGARLADLNMAVPCNGTGGPCRNYGHPPRGEYLVPVVLASGRTTDVCRPCAISIGQGGPVPVDVQVLEVRPLAALEQGTEATA